MAFSDLTNTNNIHTISTADFDTSSLRAPLKDAPIVSLRALEDGEDFEHAQLRGFSIWRRLLMNVRRRRPGRESGPSHEPLTASGDGSGPHRRKRRRFRKICCWIIVILPVAVLCFFGLFHILGVVASSLYPLLDDPDTSYLPPWAKNGGNYTTDPITLTQEVIPIPCHSHNDYWRRVPLYEAVHFGCTGVEADVWLVNDQLFVSHTTSAISSDRTFLSMYVNPLTKLLDTKNVPNGMITGTNPPKNGVFDYNPTQTLVLLVDFKNNGRDIYPVVASQLEALRSKNYLTYYDGNTVREGPITVVATGNAPFDLIVRNSTYRDIFFDAPLDRMDEKVAKVSSRDHLLPASPLRSREMDQNRRGQGNEGTDANSHFDKTNSFYASVNFGRSIGWVWWKLSKSQISRIREQVQGAHDRGLMVRYWNTPNWPIHIRNHVWEVLVAERVDYLNTDDLKAATKLDWTRRQHHGWLW